MPPQRLFRTMEPGPEAIFRLLTNVQKTFGHVGDEILFKMIVTRSEFRRILWQHAFLHQKSPLRWYIVFAGPDWFCFYYCVRNSLVALLEALFARLKCSIINKLTVLQWDVVNMVHRPILIPQTYSKFVWKNKILALGVRSHARTLTAGLPRQDHVCITTDQLVCFHNNEFDEMSCKLNFTENLRSWKKYLTQLLKPWLASRVDWQSSKSKMF